MIHIAVTLHLLGLRLADQARQAITPSEGAERGSETIEKVLWAAAVILIVGVAVAAIKGFVTSNSAKIK